MILSDICQYVSEKISVSSLDENTYISTENMLPNKSGITVATNLPSTEYTPKYNTDDILISNIRPYFKKIYKAQKQGGCSADVLVLRARQGIIPSFLYYVLSDDAFFEYATATSKGTKMPRGDKIAIMKYKVPNVSPEIQQKIASILSALDDKIELNNKINNNLEQQFKLLYNYYFCIDSSELWNTVPFSKIISFQEGPGIRNWQYVTEKGIKFINIRCINNGDLDISTANMISIDEANNKYKHFLLDKGDIVMSCSGTLGRYAIVREEHLPLCLNTSVIRFKPVEQIEDFSYIYGYLTSPEFLNKQREMACGSVQSNFGPTHLKKIFIKEPPIQLRREFHKIAYPIIKMLLTNRTENTNLSTLRDTLLPKLMKGEIDVSKVNISADKLSFTDK